MNPVIIECAINGVTSKTANPHVPVGPPEIASDALGCIEAGAAIIHNHIDRYGVSVDQAAERYLEAWRPVLAARPDALLYPTIHFDEGPSISYEHLIPLAAAGMRVGFTDPGSVNLGGTDADGIPRETDVHQLLRNNPPGLRHLPRGQMGLSLAIYEPGFLRAALAWWRAGRLPRGAMIKLYFSTEHGYRGAFRVSPDRARA